MTDEIQWLVPPASLSLSGDEEFTGMAGATVRDFWQFALGDLRMNNARGYLAEFMVGKALGITPLRRIEGGFKRSSQQERSDHFIWGAEVEALAGPVVDLMGNIIEVGLAVH